MVNNMAESEGSLKYNFDKYCLNYSEKEIDFLKSVESKERESHSSNKVSNAMKRLLELKSKISILKNIDPKSLVRIITDVEFQRFPRGSVIVEQGSISSSMYFVLMGECEIVVDNSVVGFIRAGQAFGEIAAVFREKRTASVISKDDSTTTISFNINHKSFRTYPISFAKLYKSVAKELSIKLNNINRAR